MPTIRQQILCAFICSAALLLFGCHSQPTPKEISQQEIVLGAKAHDQGNWASEADHFRKALVADPANTSLKINLATVLYREKQDSQAIQVLQEVEKTAADPGQKRTAHKYIAYIQSHSHTLVKDDKPKS